MTLAKAGIGGGALPPTAPTSVTITRNVVKNGSAPAFTVAWSGESVSPKSNFSAPKYNYEFVFGANSQSAANASAGFTSGSGVTLTTAATGVLCKARITIVDARNQSAISGYSSEVKALTRPANVGTVTASGGTNNLSVSWSAVNAGGDDSVTYFWTVFRGDNTSYTSGSTTGNSINLSSVPAGTYYAKVRAQNNLAAQAAADSQSSTVTVIAPPFFPFFPSFGPFFPSFGPSFGPSFPRFFY
jgi:hypothetical protein